MCGYTVAKAARPEQRNEPRLPQVRCVFRRDYGSLTFDVPPSETSRWRAVARVLRSPMDALSCALLPAFCTLCGSPLPQLSPVPICDSCWMEFPILSGPACSRCGDALSMPASEASPSNTDLCRTCRLVPPPFVRAVAYGLYQDRMKAAIHALKYDRIHPASRALGGMLAIAVAQLAVEAPTEMLVVPIPLHRSKYGERGFNQARALAEQALRFLRKTHPDWRLTLAPNTLMRLRATASQAGLTPRQRRLNVRGSFSISNPAEVAGMHILVIDDIYTTGATARAAAQALVKAGAASVWVATLARAQRRSGFRKGSNTSIEDAEEKAVPAIHSVAATFLNAGRFSSHDQPSF